ncbi:YezD family protein [Bacillota bacterium LX-D]|nr:YezD family protein [Bacillota bacterium LX-D]
MTLSEGIDKKKMQVSEEDLRKPLQYLESIQYGSVTLFIQEGRIVQIEKSEKIRLK